MAIEDEFVFYSPEEAIAILREEGKKLNDIALKVWRKYIAEYKPKAYRRTGESEKSIKLGEVKPIGNSTYGIEVTFENDLVWHDSIVKSKRKVNPQGHSIMLLSLGWHSAKLEAKIGIRKNFTYHQGIDYIGEVQRQYEGVRHKGIFLEIEQLKKKWTRRKV